MRVYLRAMRSLISFLTKAEELLGKSETYGVPVWIAKDEIEEEVATVRAGVGEDIAVLKRHGLADVCMRDGLALARDVKVFTDADFLAKIRNPYRSPGKFQMTKVDVDKTAETLTKLVDEVDRELFDDVDDLVESLVDAVSAERDLSSAIDPYVRMCHSVVSLIGLMKSQAAGGDVACADFLDSVNVRYDSPATQRTHADEELLRQHDEGRRFALSGRVHRSHVEGRIA